MSSVPDPTTRVDLDFGHYLTRRSEHLERHLIQGVPDYAFSMDGSLRKRLAALGPVRTLVRNLMKQLVTLEKQNMLMDAVLVGSRQFPAIFSAEEQCARQLGIGIPQVLVKYSPLMDAYTFALDDTEPIVVLSSALVEAMEPGELLFVIGHECGHIHNLHGIYTTMVDLFNPADEKSILGEVLKKLMGGPVLELVQRVAGGGIYLLLQHWSRCAEVTCDRAGLICCGDLKTAQRALFKLSTGGVHRLDGLNVEAYLEQVEMINRSPLRFQELYTTHPLTPKRLEAVGLFAQSDLFATWKPDPGSGSPTIPISEVNKRCEQILSILSPRTDGGAS